MAGPVRHPKHRHARAVDLLLRAETEIALLERVRPIGLAQEISHLIGAWRSGSPQLPRLRYRPAAKLGPLRQVLCELADRVVHDSADGKWLARRAAELELEAALAETVATKAFIGAACERFPLPTGTRGLALEQDARSWITRYAESSDDAPRYRSDDRRAAQSLWSVITKQLEVEGLRARLRVDVDLMSVAACGDDLLVIRAGELLTERAAVRIAEHEINGHLLPRMRAKRRHDVLRCGCAGAADEEEGRALLLEQRAGLMDKARYAELGARHLACTFMRRGATFVDAVRCLIDLGTPVETAIRSMVRAIRGGGLGRELAYLPAMQRLERAFSAAPELEQWFVDGRASLRYALAQHTGLTPPSMGGKVQASQ